VTSEKCIIFAELISGALFQLDYFFCRSLYNGTSKYRSGLLSALMTYNVHSGHEKKGLSDIKWDHLI